MNDERRKEIEEAISKIEEAKSIIETASNDERDEYEEMTDKQKETKVGVAMDAAATTLDETIEECDKIIEKLNDAKV